MERRVLIAQIIALVLIALIVGAIAALILGRFELVGLLSVLVLALCLGLNALLFYRGRGRDAPLRQQIAVNLLVAASALCVGLYLVVPMIVGYGLVAGLVLGAWITSKIYPEIFDYRVDPFDPSLEVDHSGVRTADGRGWEGEVRWDDLIEVDIRTTSDGPFTEDMFYILRGTDDSAAVVPNAFGDEILPWLQRLPDFNNGAIIAASTCITDETFDAWRGEPGEGSVVAEEGPVADSS